jgi:hypothetical protein
MNMDYGRDDRESVLVLKAIAITFTVFHGELRLDHECRVAYGLWCESNGRLANVLSRGEANRFINNAIKVE